MWFTLSLLSFAPKIRPSYSLVVSWVPLRRTLQVNKKLNQKIIWKIYILDSQKFYFMLFLCNQIKHLLTFLDFDFLLILIFNCFEICIQLSVLARQDIAIKSQGKTAVAAVDSVLRQIASIVIAREVTATSRRAVLVAPVQEACVIRKKLCLPRVMAVRATKVTAISKAWAKAAVARATAVVVIRLVV